MAQNQSARKRTKATKYPSFISEYGFAFLSIIYAANNVNSPNYGKHASEPDEGILKHTCKLKGLTTKNKAGALL